ncbi:MAG: VWA domain-containing protein [Rhodobiaceae bacterium]|jgi:uncharacterized protein with von Willebrand factor type A (vWA) domain|nr:VWA domain-containing protein [Rhodobiaceae bacterium]
MIADFIRILRAADIQVSPAEAIDAAAVIEEMGIGERRLLKHALGHTLAKTQFEKQSFDECFDIYFKPPEMDMGEATPTSQSGDAEAPEPDAQSQDSAGDATDASDADEADSEEGDAQEGQTGDQPGDPTGEAKKSSKKSGEPDSDKNGEDEGEAERASLVDMLSQKDSAALQAAISEAAQKVGLADAKLFTQQGMFSRRIMESMGLSQLDAHVRQLEDKGESDKADGLREGRRQLFEAVFDFVERQIAMRTKNAGRLLREDALSRIRLSNLDRSDMKIMRGLIQRLAKRLASRHSRQRKKSRRGMLDIRRTMRRNVAYDGNLFELSWRRTKVERPKLLVLCDVSGSVAAVSQFFLMFLYSLDEVMPKTRSFVFSNRAGEISDMMREGDMDQVMEKALREFGGGSTDYGMSMMDFAEATLDTIDHRTTVMILGDARSNYGDPGHLVLKEMHERARRVIWLNPEGESSWGTGDSEMKRLGAYCTHTQVCNSVKHVERVLDDLLRLST